MHERLTMIAVVMVLAAFASVGPVAAAYEVEEVRDGGALSGMVTFVGPPPKLAPLHVNKNRDVCGETRPSEALVVGPEGGVKNAVILLEGVTRGRKNDQDLIIDNVKCHFVPHVSAVMVGSRVRVKNSDPVLHNTHGYLGRPTVFNLALPNRDQVIDVTKRLTRTGIVRVLCDAHPHMLGWLVVHDSPYVAVTDARGAWRIDGVPPGTYKVTMWHEGFRQKGVDKDGRPLYDAPRTVTREVAVGPKATMTLDFEMR